MPYPDRVPFTLRHYFRVVRFEWKLDGQFGWPWYRRIFRIWWYGWKKVWYDGRTTQTRLPATNQVIVKPGLIEPPGIIFDPNAPCDNVTMRNVVWKSEEKRDA